MYFVNYNWCFVCKNCILWQQTKIAALKLAIQIEDTEILICGHKMKTHKFLFHLLSDT